MRQAELPLFGDAGDATSIIRGKVEGDLRRVLLGDRYVHYILRRGRRRTIGLTIDHRGLRVGAPPRSSMAEIESVIRKHAAWVADHLDTWRQKAATQSLPVTDGIRFPVLGQDVTLRVGQGRNVIEWRRAAAEEAPTTDGLVELCLLLRAPDFSLRLLERALKERAQDYFAARLADFCQRFNIQRPSLRLTSARTRWGSCSRQSGIRINWRLIHAAPHLIDYVIAHELAHLREMNHTARFWIEVGHLFPDWQAARRELRQLGDHLPGFVSPPSDHRSASNLLAV